MLMSVGGIIAIVLASVMTAMPHPANAPSSEISHLVDRGVAAVSAAPTQSANTVDLPRFRDVDVENNLSILNSVVDGVKAADVAPYGEFIHYATADGLEWVGNEGVGWALCEWVRNDEGYFVGTPSLVAWWNQNHLDKYGDLKAACSSTLSDFTTYISGVTYPDGRQAVDVFHAIYPCNEVVQRNVMIGLDGAKQQKIKTICGLF